MALCEFSSKREAGGQRDFVPVGLFNSVRTECWSQDDLLGNHVPSVSAAGTDAELSAVRGHGIKCNHSRTLRRHEFDVVAYELERNIL